MGSSDWGKKFADAWSVSLRERVMSGLVSGGSVKWRELGVTLVGGLFYVIWSGVIQVQVMIQQFFELVFVDFSSFVISEVSRYVGVFVSQASRAWSSAGIDLGFLQLPFNVTIVLLAFAIIAIGLEVSNRG